ncbi:MAG: aminopeptidase P N-terminal domain-containing protein [Eubacteriaceae bacterium]|nr:aminopeptidase P N-terminal domain-containing protein [Eubacteriaceae bacterium]
MRAEFHADRREKFIEKMKEGSFAVLTSGELVVSTNDENFMFEVDRNFYYLTGIDFPGILLILEKEASKEPRTTLFVPEKDPDKEKWTGFIPSREELSEKSGIALCDIKYLAEFDSAVTALGEGERYSVCYAYYQDVPDNIPEPAPNLIYYRLCDEYLDIEVEDIMEIMKPLRSVKTPGEVEAITGSAKITDKALRAVAYELSAGKMEYEMIALFNYTVARNHARNAFHTIAASGEYATILHYIDGENEMKEGSVLLFDCGAAKEWYNSDVTRTFPVSGSFDEKQRMIYSIVLEANKLVAREARPGISLAELNEITKEFLASELKKIGLIASDDELVKYYYHSVSHSLGLDTHDPFDRNAPLAPGNVITDEPGLYIREWGFGIRIEDDLLITEDGCRVLTDFIPKEIEEIEALIRG